MNVVKSWIYLIFRMMVKSKGFIALLIALPVMGLIFAVAFADKDSEKLTCYIYAEEPDEFTAEVMDDLLGTKSGYRFVEASSQDDIESAVRDHSALCGFIFSSEQMERVLSGKTMRNVTLIERVGNLKSDIVSEIFFASYYKVYTKYYTPVFLGEEDADTYYSNYDKLMNSSIFDFSIEELDYEESGSDIWYGRNLAGIIYMVFAMLLVSRFIEDRDKGILMAVSHQNQVWFRLLYFAVPVAMLIPSMIICITIESGFNSIIHNILITILYAVMLIIFAFSLSFILRNKSIIYGLIPVSALWCLIICPTFTDLSIYYQSIKILRLFCLPYYFMV